MVKVLCPICGIEGFLEKRENSYQVKHYRGYQNGKRLYTTHKIPNSFLLSPSNSLGINRNKNFKFNLK